MEQLKISELYSDLSKTLAKELMESKTYPWEVLPCISQFIVELGNTLSEEEYEKKGENVWIAKSAKVAPTAYINGPAIIGKNAEVRHCAFIRGNALVGEGAVVGNSTELKNVHNFQRKIGQKTGSGERKRSPLRDRTEKVRRYAGRRSRSRLRFCAEPRDCRRKPYQYLSSFFCERSNPLSQHLQEPERSGR